MKRLLCLILSILTLASLCACGGSSGKYEEIVLTEENYSEYFEVIYNLPYFQTDSFGNLQLFAITGFVKLKDEYYDKLVPSANSKYGNPIKFNVYYVGNEVEATVNFDMRSYTITTTGPQFSQTIEVDPYNMTVNGKEMYAGQFGIVGGGNTVGSATWYICGKISEVEIKDVVGSLYLYK